MDAGTVSKQLRGLSFPPGYHKGTGPQGTPAISPVLTLHVAPFSQPAQPALCFGTDPEGSLQVSLAEACLAEMWGFDEYGGNTHLSLHQQCVCQTGILLVPLFGKGLFGRGSLQLEGLWWYGDGPGLGSASRACTRVYTGCSAHIILFKTVNSSHGIVPILQARRRSQS